MTPQLGSVGRFAGLRPSAACSRVAAPRSRTSLQVRNAISRKQKESVVESLKDCLQDISVVYSMRFEGITVNEMAKFRQSMPEGARVYVCKNTLMGRALAEVEDGKWECLSDALSLDNCWVFLKEEDIRGGVQSFLDFEAELASAVTPPKDGSKPKAPTEVVACAMDGKLLKPAEFRRLKDLPTKDELYAKIAGSIKAVPTKVATSVKAVPRKLALAVRALSELSDDKSLTVEQAAAQKS